jgi:hypothetical protein
LGESFPTDNTSLRKGKMNKDELYFYNRGFNDCLAKGLNPVKELTDEEIHIVISNILNTEEFCLEDMPSDSFLIDFARAILRKAQEK